MAEFQEVMHRYIRMCVNSRCETCPLQKKGEEIYKCKINYDCLRFLKDQPKAAEETINDWYYNECEKETKEEEIIHCRHCRYFSGENDIKGVVTAVGYCMHEKHKIMPLNAGFYCADAELTEKKWRLE